MDHTMFYKGLIKLIIIHFSSSSIYKGLIKLIIIQTKLLRFLR
jgi:hypothetical protein